MTEDISYQQIFDAFNATDRTPNGAENLKRFEQLTANPETTLQTFKKIRQQGSEQLFGFHKTTYVRTICRVLKKSAWDAKYTPALIELTDWLISLTNVPNRNTNYKNCIAELLTLVQTKQQIPESKRVQWTNVVTRKSKEPPIPDDLVQPERVFRVAKRTHFQAHHLSYNNYDMD